MFAVGDLSAAARFSRETKRFCIVFERIQWFLKHICFNLRGAHVLGRDKRDRRDGSHPARARAGCVADAFALCTHSGASYIVKHSRARACHSGSAAPAVRPLQYKYNGKNLQGSLGCLWSPPRSPSVVSQREIDRESTATAPRGPEGAARPPHPSPRLPTS